MAGREKTQNELIRELQELNLKYDQLKSSYEKDIAIRNLTEEKLLKRSVLLSAFNQYSIDLAEKDNDHIQQFIVDRFKSLFEVRAVWIFRYDEELSELAIETSTFTEKEDNILMKFLAGGLKRHRTAVDKEKYNLIIETGVKVFSSLHEISFGQIPELIGRAIEKLFSIGWFQGAALIDKGKLFGTMVIAGFKGQDELPADIVKIFAELTSNILRRKQTENKLLMSEQEILKLNAGLEQHVIERTVQLEAANTELQAFAYSVSHDLRAPLRAIDGFSKFVLEDYGSKLDDEGKRLLGLIRSNTQKMDKLITDILSLSRISRSEHNKSNIDMRKMALSMFNEAVSCESQKRMEFIVDELPEIYADPTYIKQVWINLISNAIKFSSLKSKPEIRIGSNRENGFEVYHISDNGAGFNPDYSDKLFGVFQRLHNSNEFEGTGVGLAIVQRIIHRHGGKVWAKGEEGKGATFYFSLPVIKIA